MIAKAVFFIYLIVVPGSMPPTYEASRYFLTFSDCAAYQEDYPAESAMSACFPVTEAIEELS